MQAPFSRVGDVLVAVAVIIFTLPLIGLVCLAIKLDGEGPVFSYEPRVGRDGRRFSAIKFRTTEHDPELASRAMWDRRARETSVGRALHYTRIEELPLLCNVLLGDLRLIGSERTEGRDLQQLAKWAAWVAAAAIMVELMCCRTIS
jgi:lipopolysaccharide/colanic/teichoic acid biosynthesis glycosyltransferase